MPFPWLPSTKAFLCAVSLFLKAEEYDHYKKLISEFHKSQLTDLKSRQSYEKSVKLAHFVTFINKTNADVLGASVLGKATGISL